MMELLKRLARYYPAEILLSVVMLYVALLYAFEPSQLVSAIARKTALASAGLIFYYISRYLKIGVVDWDREWRQRYAIALLIYTAVVFSLG
ncbi:MAG: hypothetical protein P3W91_003660 [Fervidobacterium sp.]|nr:hypothetical protein [Fervidobacterium sp.]